MRRIPSCIGLDAENKAYLDSREESAAEIINSLIKAYREREDVQETIGDLSTEKPSPISKDIVKDISETITSGTVNKEKLIREYLRENPGRLYAVKKNEDVVNKGYLADLQHKIGFKKRADFTLAQIRNVLREEVDEFDERKYLLEREKMGKL